MYVEKKEYWTNNDNTPKVITTEKSYWDFSFFLISNQFFFIELIIVRPILIHLQFGFLLALSYSKPFILSWKLPCMVSNIVK